MKKHLFLLLVLFLGSFNVFCQDEDLAKILDFSDKAQLDAYLHDMKWKEVKENLKPSEDGIYYLYQKKNSSGGLTFLAVFLRQYMHYQVYFDKKKEYNPVLSYDDFMNMPNGKSRYNDSYENKAFAIKSVSFEDPKETRNKNLFFGKIKVADNPDITIEKEAIKLDKTPQKVREDDQNDEDPSNEQGQ